MSFFYDEKHGEIKGGRIIEVAIGAVVALILFISSVSRVPVGYVGVQTNMAKVTGRTYSSGWYFKVPFAEHIIDLNIQKQTIAYDEIEGELAGKEIINMTLTMVYSLNSDKAAYVYENYGSNYIDTLMPRQEVFDVVKSVVAKYDIEDVRSSRAAIMSEAVEHLQERFSDRGVTITSLALENYNFGDLEAAINAEVQAKQERKTVAEQNQLAVEKAENEKKVAALNAEKNAEVKRTEAQAEADALKLKAQGEADAIKLKADAQAEANKKLSESITGELNKYKEIEKWNGSKATIILGESSNQLVQVPVPNTSTTEETE